VESAEPDQLDYRFSLANERTFLAWIRTALALVAGGIVAAKALEFNHDVWRWILAVPREQQCPRSSAQWATVRSRRQPICR
jgi:uncharacterized membrane protein YidH (DUF202 family)